MLSLPSVTVVVPCFNAGGLLQETLNSVLPALEQGMEVVVVNDGSTDLETLTILHNIDPRMRVLHTPNRGLAAARNTGIRAAKGRYIFPLDADDLAHLPFLNSAQTLLDANSNFDVVAGDYEKFGAEQGRVHCRWDPARQWYVNGITASSMFRKSVWETTGGYDETMNEGYEDWEFWLSALASGKEVAKLNELAFFYRIRPNSMVRSMTLQQHERLLAYMHQKHHAAFLKQYIGQVNDLQAHRTDYRLLCKALLGIVMAKLRLRK